MINIRKGTFETNSSSTHSICISTEEENFQIPEKLEIDLDKDMYEFGWEYEEWNTVEEKLAYIIMGIISRSWYYTSLTEAAAQIEKLYQRLSEMGVKQITIKGLELILYDKRVYFSHSYDSYVDHAGEMGEFLEAILSRSNLLKNYLFSDKSFVLGGNDNSDGYPEINVEYPHMEYFKGN